jgi:ankyrin repeat protein
VIWLLAELGAKLDLPDLRGVRPIFSAASAGHAGVLLALHQCDVDMNAVSNLGASAAFMAAMRGHHGAVRSLHFVGADLDLRNKNGATPLHGPGPPAAVKRPSRFPQ